MTFFKMQGSFEIPDGIVEKAIQNLQLNNSKDAYDKERNILLNWMTENCVEYINEAVLLGYKNIISIAIAIIFKQRPKESKVLDYYEVSN